MKYFTHCWVNRKGIDKNIDNSAQNCTTCENFKNNPPKIDTQYTSLRMTHGTMAKNLY